LLLPQGLRLGREGLLLGLDLLRRGQVDSGEGWQIDEFLQDVGGGEVDGDLGAAVTNFLNNHCGTLSNIWLRKCCVLKSTRNSR
jgi:hypothetical protein